VLAWLVRKSEIALLVTYLVMNRLGMLFEIAGSAGQKVTEMALLVTDLVMNRLNMLFESAGSAS
jgi:hypothetical protein